MILRSLQRVVLVMFIAVDISSTWILRGPVFQNPIRVILPSANADPLHIIFSFSIIFTSRPH